MPSMPAMPSMPGIPSIPGLRKSNPAEDGGIANEGLATSPDKQAPNIGVEEGIETSQKNHDDDDRSRYVYFTFTLNPNRC